MKALLIRRPGWGVDFGRAINHLSSKIKSVKSTTFMGHITEETTHLINWGFNDIEVHRDRFELVNKPDPMRLVSNKRRFRQLCMEEGAGIVPCTWLHNFDEGIVFPCIVRPERHKQGENLFYCEDSVQLQHAARVCGHGYYISEYIPKVAEYRVYMCQGKVAAISKKVVENPEVIAWNHAGGDCEFVNVRWDNWPIAVADVATRAFNLSGLHFGGVDVMVDADGGAYVLEVNSAISLPFLEDGEDLESRISYNQKVMIRCLEWLVDEKSAAYDYQGRRQNSYHQYIHAAMKERVNV